MATSILQNHGLSLTVKQTAASADRSVRDDRTTSNPSDDENVHESELNPLYCLAAAAVSCGSNEAVASVSEAGREQLQPLSLQVCAFIC